MLGDALCFLVSSAKVLCCSEFLFLASGFCFLFLVNCYLFLFLLSVFSFLLHEFLFMNSAVEKNVKYFSTAHSDRVMFLW